MWSSRTPRREAFSAARTSSRLAVYEQHKALNYCEQYQGETFENEWDCGLNTIMEATNVVKTNPYQQGGVLCCRDFEE